MTTTLKGRGYIGWCKTYAYFVIARGPSVEGRRGNLSRGKGLLPKQSASYFSTHHWQYTAMRIYAAPKACISHKYGCIQGPGTIRGKCQRNHSAYMDSFVLVGVRIALNIRPTTLTAAQTRKAT